MFGKIIVVYLLYLRGYQIQNLYTLESKKDNFPPEKSHHSMGTKSFVEWTYV